VISYNEKEKARVLPFFGQETMIQAEAKGPLTEKAYKDALGKCRKLSRSSGLDPLFSKHQLDALVAPTGHPAWPTDLVNGDHFLGSSSTPAAVSGYPSISLPAGYLFGLPVGLSLIGKPWQEGTLIRMAYAYEQATEQRRAPTFLPSVDLSAGSTRVSRRVAAWLALAANGTVRAAALSAQDPTTDSLPKASVDSTADSLTAPQRYKNKIFGLPFVGYSPTTKFIFGAGGQIQFKTGESAYDSTTRASNVSAGFSITTAGQWGVSFSNDFFTLHNRWWFNSRILTGYAPTDYYGIGPHRS
jgi:Asp-tRNAAsn/Glu-tRNAGln amidotransferase A subunit and related amidases